MHDKNAFSLLEFTVSSLLFIFNKNSHVWSIYAAPPFVLKNILYKLCKSMWTPNLSHPFDVITMSTLLGWLLTRVCSVAVGFVFSTTRVLMRSGF